MKINLDEVMKRNGVSQASIVEWCFRNMQKFTWDLISLAGCTYIYFDTMADYTAFVDEWFYS